jgi:hypothetical protein
MPDFLTSPFADGPNVLPLNVLVRLLAALILGWLVAWIYRRTRANDELPSSLPVTLVLLSVLIAMVTQVIGDNVARAFSLVGALSIVRFRTVVRDTLDTAYVIFAVVVGMAAGARNLWVGVIGLAVIGLAAWIMMTRTKSYAFTQPQLLLNLRIGLGHDLNSLLGSTLDSHLNQRELMHVGTAGKGAALDVTYKARLAPNSTPDRLVKELNLIDGVQKVEVQRRDFEMD